MSYVALATSRFEEAAFFYGQALGFSVVTEWNRPAGRGRRYDLGGGLRLELLDNMRERAPLELNQPGGRIHVVVEVDDIEAARRRIAVATPDPQTVRGAHVCFSCTIPTVFQSPFSSGCEAYRGHLA